MSERIPRKPSTDEAVYFGSPEEFRAWLEVHHASAAELWVGFHKRATGRPSMTWPQSVDEALCFGWIDGLRKSVDAARYKIRFTPRRPTSNWSAINVARAAELVAERRMRAPGLLAYENRREDRTARYAYEQEGARLSETHERDFRRDPKAWAFYQAQPPWYRRTTGWWVASAKREETRERRLRELMARSREGRWIGPAAASGRPAAKKR